MFYGKKELINIYDEIIPFLICIYLLFRNNGDCLETLSFQLLKFMETYILGEINSVNIYLPNVNRYQPCLINYLNIS